MIGWLSGVVRVRSPEALILDVGGVGYLVQLSLNSFCQLPRVGGHAELEVFTYVREDQITLFGFVVEGEREAHRLLMGVTGIGPRLALNILSGISPTELGEAIQSGNLKRLQMAPGVGKKLAERMVLELKDKFSAPAVIPITGPQEQKSASADARQQEDLVLALTSLGYKKPEVDAVVRKLPTGLGLEQLIREALRLLQPR